MSVSLPASSLTGGTLTRFLPPSSFLSASACFSSPLLLFHGILGSACTRHDPACSCRMSESDLREHSLSQRLRRLGAGLTLSSRRWLAPPFFLGELVSTLGPFEARLVRSHVRPAFLPDSSCFFSLSSSLLAFFCSLCVSLLFLSALRWVLFFFNF